MSHWLLLNAMGLVFVVLLGFFLGPRLEKSVRLTAVVIASILAFVVIYANLPEPLHLFGGGMAVREQVADLRILAAAVGVVAGFFVVYYTYFSNVFGSTWPLHRRFWAAAAIYLVTGLVEWLHVLGSWTIVCASSAGTRVAVLATLLIE